LQRFSNVGNNSWVCGGILLLLFVKYSLVSLFPFSVHPCFCAFMAFSADSFFCLNKDSKLSAVTFVLHISGNVQQGPVTAASPVVGF
jgi:hypothetical protein